MRGPGCRSALGTLPGAPDTGAPPPARPAPEKRRVQARVSSLPVRTGAGDGGAGERSPKGTRTGTQTGASGHASATSRTRWVGTTAGTPQLRAASQHRGDRSPTPGLPHPARCPPHPSPHGALSKHLLVGERTGNCPQSGSRPLARACASAAAWGVPTLLGAVCTPPLSSPKKPRCGASRPRTHTAKDGPGGGPPLLCALSAGTRGSDSEWRQRREARGPRPEPPRQTGVGRVMQTAFRPSTLASPRSRGSERPRARA